MDCTLKFADDTGDTHQFTWKQSCHLEGTKQHGGMDQYEPLKFNNIKFCTYEEPFVIIQSQDLMAWKQLCGKGHRYCSDLGGE